MIGKALRFIKELVNLLFVADWTTNFNYWSAIANNFRAVMRLNLGPAHQAMWGKQCVFNVNGKRVELPGKWFGYAQEIYARKIYWPFPEFRLKPGMKIVDAGASGGIYSIPAALLGSEVIAIEANKESFDELKENAARNGAGDKIHAEWAVVGGESGFFAAGTVPRQRLAEILDKYDFDRIDLLKIDIEGSEFELLRRDNDWLSKTDKVVMEVERNFGDPKEIGNILTNKGFKVMFVNNSQKKVTEITDSSGYIFALR